MAVNTMTAIKKKLHLIKTDKENAIDRVDHLEQKLGEIKTIYEKVRFIHYRKRKVENGIHYKEQKGESPSGEG